MRRLIFSDDDIVLKLRLQRVSQISRKTNNDKKKERKKERKFINDIVSRNNPSWHGINIES
jgi:hypothetical protein